MLKDLIQELHSGADPKKAEIYQRFFKTGEGEYGEGDVFIGLTVPFQRKIAKKYKDLSFAEVEKLLQSPVHEERLVALFILMEQYKDNKRKIVSLYLHNRRHVNNWDLVDLSAHKILGDYLKDKDRKILYKLAESKSIWDKRIAIIATFAFIRDNDFQDALKISEILLKDGHDLIHKAVGWMLREIGNRDLKVEEEFLEKHYRDMPRTMLRYAIEKFDEDKRIGWLKRS